MTPNAFNLLLAALAMVVLTFAVGLRMLYSRVQEMRRSVCIRKRRPLQKRWLPTWRTFRQRITTAILFETPVLFYALVACAVAAAYAPPWLVIGAWCYFGLRVVHTIIHCTYNRVMHRLAAFAIGFVLLVGLWIAFVLTLPNRVLL